MFDLLIPIIVVLIYLFKRVFIYIYNMWLFNCCVVHHYFYVNGSLRPYVLPGRLILLPVIVSIALVGSLLHLYCCNFFFFYIFAWLRSTVLHLIKLVESTMIAYLISYGIEWHKPYSVVCLICNVPIQCS